MTSCAPSRPRTTGPPEDLAALAADLQGLVRKAGLRPDVRDALEKAYAELGGRVGSAPALVAVRSSATSEDAADTSFAGMNRTFTNVAGIDGCRVGGRGRLGLALRRTGARLPRRPRGDGRAGDRRRGPGHGPGSRRRASPSPPTR